MGSHLLGRTTSSGIVPVTEGLNSLSEVAQQVPSVGDLNGRWGALADAIGIGARPIASDNFDARAIAQPICDARGLTVRQEIDHLVCLKVHKHRAVAAAASPRPVVNAEHTRRWNDPG
jgi:hypothetical protein